MFGDIMGNMEEQQKKMQETLSQITLTESINGITIKANAASEILDIDIANELLTADRKEEVQDMLILAINNITGKIKEEEAKLSQSMINDILPGMGGLGSLFG